MKVVVGFGCFPTKAQSYTRSIHTVTIYIIMVNISFVEFLVRNADMVLSQCDWTSRVCQCLAVVFFAYLLVM